MQDSKGFSISEGRIGGWVQDSIITTEKAVDLLGNAWRQLMFSGFDISSLWLCKASTILHCAQRFSYLLTEPLMRSDSLACRLIAPRYSWQTYPDLAVSRLGSEVCENARFQRVLNFWRPNWWMSLGFDNYNREKQLTCWAMHEDSWCFLVSISALCGYAKHLPSCTENKSSVIYWQNRLWEVIHWHADW